MDKKLLFGIIGLLLVGALALGTTAVVTAQDGTPTPESENKSYFSFHHGFGFHHWAGGQAGLEAAAETLGMTIAELTAEIRSGKSLADLADEADVDLAEVQKAAIEAVEEATREAIEQAVKDEELTREHADWLLEGLDNGYWGPGKMGHFGGRGHFGRHGGFGGFGRFHRPSERTAPSGVDA